jgi:hypothetical protein
VTHDPARTQVAEPCPPGWRQETGTSLLPLEQPVLEQPVRWAVARGVLGERACGEMPERFLCSMAGRRSLVLRNEVGPLGQMGVHVARAPGAMPSLTRPALTFSQGVKVRYGAGRDATLATRPVFRRLLRVPGACRFGAA